MATTLRMQFLTKSGDKEYISIANPVSAITSLEVEDIMDSIIQRNIFITKSGELTAKVKAEVITTTNKVYSYELDDDDEI